MNYLLLALICILPFSDLILQIKDIWHSQGAIFQVGLLVCFSSRLFLRSIKPLQETLRLKNLPLSILTFWLGIITIYWWNKGVNVATYNFIVFMPFFNFLCLILFYQLIIDYLNVKDIERTFKYFSYVIGLICIYSLLQILNLDQFHRHFSVPSLNDPLIGTIGNSSHLAGYLTLCLPILFYIKTKFSAISIILVWVIIFLTLSATGIIGALIVTIFYNMFFRIRTKFDWLLVILLTSLILGIVLFKGYDWIMFNILNTSGRLSQWRELFPLFKQWSITGGGLGLLNATHYSLNKDIWSHAHNEYYQLAIEGGLIGVSIVIWGIVRYFKMFWQIKQKEISVCLATIFLAFLFNSLFNFSAHLWLMSVLAMFSYAGLFVINSKTL